MTQPIYEYKGQIYPDYLKRGNAVQFIIPTAQQFCKGLGLDIGGTNEWKFPEAKIINPIYHLNTDAFNLPEKVPGWDYIFSSHCLEHLDDYVKALEHWRYRLKENGQIFLYLPHPDMQYWQPQNCHKHLHMFTPEHIAQVLRDIGFGYVLASERDLNWSFAVTGTKI